MVRPPSAGPKVCQVDGCGMDLTELKPYFHRAKVCMSHCKAPEVLLGGMQHRFCQQCGKLEPIDLFEGARRSCSKMLERHSTSLRQKRAREVCGLP